MFSPNERNVPRPQEFYELLNDYYFWPRNSITNRMNDIFKEILNESECEENITPLLTPCLIYDYYQLMNIFLESHVKDIQTKSIDLSDEDLLSFHKDRWEIFESSSCQLDEICRELYDHFHKTAHRFSFHSIYKLAINAWDLHTEKFTENVTETVLKMIDNKRRGEEVNKSLIEVTMRLLKANMRLKGRHPATLRCERHNLAAPHLDKIEDTYINTAYRFYKKLSSRLIVLKQNNILDYLKKAISIIFTEQFNCSKAYLMPPHIVNYITLSLSQVLIHDHITVLTTYFDKILNEYQVTSLRLFYFYLKAFPDPELLKIFSKSLCNNIKSNAEQIMDHSFLKGEIDSKLYIENILKMRKIYSDLVTVIFESEEEFVKAHRKATRYIVNNIPTKTNSTAEAAELLASFCINVLKKPEHRLLYPTDDLRFLFRYLENKHIFEEAFYQLLVSCLMRGTPYDLISFKIEVITFMRLCSDTTRNFLPDQMIKSMFKDIETSSDLTNDFRNKRVEENDIELQFKILREGIWPFLENTLPITIPKALSRQIESFSQFYKLKHSHRKLVWLHYMFEAEVHSYCFEKDHIFNLDVIQAAVMLKFNEANCWSLKQLQRDTKIEKQLLGQAIKILIEANILITKYEENSEDSCDDRTVEINPDYEEQNEQITLTKLNYQTQDTVQKDDFTISEESKFFAIQAAVTRIMKKTLTAKHEQLVADVFKDMISKFDFTTALVDKSIDKLISLEFLERSEEDCRQYNYIP